MKGISTYTDGSYLDPSGLGFTSTNSLGATKTAPVTITPGASWLFLFGEGILNIASSLILGETAMPPLRRSAEGYFLSLELDIDRLSIVIV